MAFLLTSPSHALQILSRSLSPYALLKISQSNSRAGVSATVFLLWDTLINFSDEVEYIWQGPNTWIKYMYIFIRHVPLLAQIALVTIITSNSTNVHFSKNGCRAWIIFEASVIEATILAVELVLVIRVYALYSRNRTILCILSVLFLAEVASMLMSIAKTIPEFEFTAQCLTITAPSIFMACWISSLAFESILFILTLIQFFRVVHRGIGEQTILFVIVRDGTWAFALIFGIFLVNTLMYQLDTPFAGTCYAWALSIMSFAGSHVLLNLRKLGTTPHLPSTFETSRSYFSTNPDMKFGTAGSSSNRIQDTVTNVTGADIEEIPMEDIPPRSDAP